MPPSCSHWNIFHTFFSIKNRIPALWTRPPWCESDQLSLQHCVYNARNNSHCLSSLLFKSVKQSCLKYKRKTSLLMSFPCCLFIFLLHFVYTVVMSCWERITLFDSFFFRPKPSLMFRVFLPRFVTSNVVFYSFFHKFIERKLFFSVFNPNLLFKYLVSSWKWN